MTSRSFTEEERATCKHVYDRKVSAVNSLSCLMLRRVKPVLAESVCLKKKRLCFNFILDVFRNFVMSQMDAAIATFELQFSIKHKKKNLANQKLWCRIQFYKSFNEISENERS